MQNPQKKSYKTFQEKSKGYNSNTYDYDSYDQSSYQNSHYNSNKPYGYSKPKKYYQEYAAYQPVKSYIAKANKTESQANEQVTPNTKERKDQEKSNDEKNTGAQRQGPSELEFQSNKGGSKSKAKGDKKPEKQLYSARKKHNNGEDANRSKGNEDSNPESMGQNEENKKLQKVSLKEKEKKEDSGPLSEEDKSFLSNVSTETSDKAKLNEEESFQKENTSTKDTRPRVKPPHRILFQGVVESERYIQTVDIYEDEEDYEVLLDRICEHHDFRGKMALYFKINFLRTIYDAVMDKSRVEPALNRNVDLNAKIILCENGLREIDEIVLPYLEYYPSNPLYLQR